MSHIPSSYIDDGISDIAPARASPKPKTTPSARHSRTLSLRKEVKQAETTTAAWPPSEYSAIDDSYTAIDTAATDDEATEKPTKRTKQEKTINWEAGSAVESFIDDGVSISGQSLAHTDTNVIQKEPRHRRTTVIQDTPKAQVVVRRASLPPQAPRVGPVLVRRTLVDNTANVDPTPSRPYIRNEFPVVRSHRPLEPPAFIIWNKTKAVTIIDSTYPPVIPRSHLRSLTYPEVSPSFS